eukprot:1263878-Pleurochrysis_carterae.AAC.2
MNIAEPHRTHESSGARLGRRRTRCGGERRNRVLPALAVTESVRMHADPTSCKHDVCLSHVCKRDRYTSTTTLEARAATQSGNEQCSMSGALKIARPPPEQ